MYKEYHLGLLDKAEETVENKITMKEEEGFSCGEEKLLLDEWKENSLMLIEHRRERIKKASNVDEICEAGAGVIETLQVLSQCFSLEKSMEVGFSE